MDKLELDMDKLELNIQIPAEKLKDFLAKLSTALWESDAVANGIYRINFDPETSVSDDSIVIMNNDLAIQSKEGDKWVYIPYL